MIQTDSRHRFERGIDSRNPVFALEMIQTPDILRYALSMGSQSSIRPGDDSDVVLGKM